MAISTIQVSSFINGFGSQVATFGAGATKRVVVAVQVDNTTAPSTPTDNGSGNTYVLDFSFAGTAPGATEKFWYYSCDAVAGSPTQVTVNVAANHKAVVYEIDGAVAGSTPANYLDITGGGSGGTAASTTTPSFAFTTLTAGSWAAGILSTATAGSDQNFTAGASYTSDGVNPDTVYFEHTTSPFGASGSHNLDGSIPLGNGDWDFVVVAYKAAAGSSGIAVPWYRA